MNPTPLWKAFVIAFGLVTLCIVSNAGIKIYQYVRLSESAAVTWHQFQTVHLGKDAYTLEAKYKFDSPEGMVQGISRLNSLRVRSRAGIDATRDRAQAADWTVWYRPNSPNISSLEHAFPWRASVYAGLLVLAFGYIITMSWIICRQ